jgi:catechol 2,3-dioxygenase-like lactoylglutathione lyase family enzyme
MDWKIELIFVPVTDVERAKHFYADQLGFPVDYDQTVNDDIRFIQITPPGSACSIAFGKGLNDMAPGSQRSVQIVVADADAARAHLIDNGIDASEVEELAWGRFVTFSDPDGNRWTLQQVPERSANA